jgi:hypothetical protein
MYMDDMKRHWLGKGEYSHANAAAGLADPNADLEGSMPSPAV